VPARERRTFEGGFAKAALSLVPLFQFDKTTLGKVDPSATVDIDLAWVAKPAG
jgi:hypothetical protein